MTPEEALRFTNRNMVAFDLALGAGALLAPKATLAVLGHERPSADAEHLFRRCGPIWLTFAAAHAVAELRGVERDWWALAWLRGTELATDVVWSQSEPSRGRARGPGCGSPARRTWRWPWASAGLHGKVAAGNDATARRSAGC